MLAVLFKNLVDMHSHTCHSFDAEFPVDELVASSVSRGLKTVAFTDHVEMDVFRTDSNRYDVTAEESYKDIKRAKKQYENQIEICVGVELGEPCYNLEETEKLLCEKNYDIVIGSLHNLKGLKDFSQIDYFNDGYDIYELLHQYYEDQKQIAQWARFDTMAHIIYPLRYMIGKYGISIDRSRISGDIDELLDILAKKEKALEINTSGLRQKIGTTMPDENIVRRFRELGGKFVTVGSDSHTADDMGAGIAQGYEIAKRCGFDSVLIFKNRQPVEIPIE